MKKNYLLSLVILTGTIWVSFGCGPLAIEKWNGKIYVYVSNDLSFERKQDNDLIRFDNPKANHMKCMTDDDFQTFLKTYVVPQAVRPPKGSQ